MTVEVYIGANFQFGQERRAFGLFLQDMSDQYRDSEELYCIVVEPLANDASMDLLLISSTAIIIVELKELIYAEPHEGPHIRLIGGESGAWQYRLPSGKCIYIGDQHKSRNPYRQVRDMRYELAKWIESYSQQLFGAAWSKNEALEHLFAWVAFSPGCDGDMSDLDLPSEALKFHRPPYYKWFKVMSVTKLGRELDYAPDTRLRLSDKQIRNFAGQLGEPCPDLVRFGVESVEIPFTPAPNMVTLADRQDKCAELIECLNKDHASIIALGGPGGVGKTALAAWLVNEASQRGSRIRWMDCRERADITLDRLLRGISYDIPNRQRALVRDASRTRVDRLTAALDSLSERPTLLVFDDYHLLKNRGAMNQFIKVASRYPGRLRVLLTTRERLTDPDLRQAGVCQEIEVERLSVEAFPDLIRALGLRLNLTTDQMQTVWEKTSGNARVLGLSEGLIRRHILTGTLTEMCAYKEGCSEEFFATLLDMVSRDAQDLAQQLCIVRSRLSFPLISCLSERPPDKVSALTIELEDKYFLQRVESAGSYVMDDLLRNFLYERMEKKSKREAHRKAGDCFVKLAEKMHSEQDRADYLVEALDHFECGAERQAILKQSPEAYKLLWKAGDWDRAQSIAEKALQVARSMPDQGKVCHWFIEIARCKIDRTQIEQARQHLRDAESNLPRQEAERDRLRMQILIQQGRLAYHENVHDLDNATVCYKKALDVAKKLGEQYAQADCLFRIGQVERRRLEYDQARKYFEQARDLAASLGGEGQTLVFECECRLGVVVRKQLEHTQTSVQCRDDNDIAGVEQHLQAAEKIASATGNRRWQEEVRSHLGRLQAQTGRMLDAERSLQEALAIARGIRNRRGIRIELTRLIDVLIHLGKLEEAKILLEESEQLNIDENDQVGIAWNRKHRGQIMKAKGDLAGGNALIQEGIDILVKTKYEEYIPEFKEAQKSDNAAIV